MSHFDPLLQRNREYAVGQHRQLSIMPRHGVFVVTCLDPRVDPTGFLGVAPGDAVVVRNAGGRVTPEVLLDLAFIAALAERQVTDGPLFEIAVIHHTDCGTRLLAVDGFRRAFAARTGTDEAALAEQAVTDPESTVRIDVERVRSSHWLPGRVTVSGHVYDLHSGAVRTVEPVGPVGAAASSSTGAGTGSSSVR
jgi:carbonic anhydrase